LQAARCRYLIGIDLGTTHTVVAFADTQTKDQDIHVFEIEQLTAPGEVYARALLPSVRYHPAAGELSATDTTYSPAGEQAIVGELARVLGAKTQGRLVTSAKSWLSHPSIDHHANILPWGSSEEIEKVSPVDASSSYLAHVRAVWDQRFTEFPMHEQDIVITVPASFDEAARSLTLAAAQKAGLPHIRLLEEPQAVCYDWLRRHQHNLQQELENVHLLLVCDVGGGTTDLTLIRIEHGEGDPKLNRIAVGDHLMLGGDNIDLALAHLAEKRIGSENQRLSTADLSQLIGQCRIAKERILSDHSLASYKVTLLGSGAKLIGGARSTELTKEEVLKIALDGFFPLSEITELPDKKRSGVVEFGLPYAAEPAVSKHIAAFLTQHQQAARKALESDCFVPDAVLLNGGVFRSSTISRRVLDILASWRLQPLRHLANHHPELAVAYGAVAYSKARRGKHTRIGGGAARSYFLLIDADSSAVQQGICILPKGSEEGSEIILKQRQFLLLLGQPVRFHLASFAGDAVFKPGEITAIKDDEFHSLPPLAVAFADDEEDRQTEVTVQLSVAYTEVGTLQIQCVAVENTEQRWDVEFQIRSNAPTLHQYQADLPTNFHQAAAKIQDVFGTKSKQVSPKAVKSLRADIEKLLGPRAEWNTLTLRALYAELLAGIKYRRRSANHERIWLNLCGYSLRPGFGFALDDWRVEQIWKIYQHNLQFVNEVQNWTEWWTLWRRIAGGLSLEAQERIFNDLSKYLNPASARQASVVKLIKKCGYEDMVRLAAVLERLPIEKKIQLAEWLLKRLQRSSEPNQTWWAVGRIGSRIPFHGSSHNVVPAITVSLWLKQILLVDWKKIPQAGFAATLITRMSGDRSLDIEAATRQQIIEKLKASKAPGSWLIMVEQVKELNAAEEKQIFGEALPPGLKLIGSRA
jgi:molecular chaperone DnaK (HSP70)